MIRLNAPRRLWRNRSGQFVMLFALALPMMVFTAGLSINFGMMTTTRHHLQSALDAGLLAAVGTESATSAERIAIATQFAQSNFRNPYDSINLNVTVTHDTVLDQFDAQATVDLPVVFGEFFGTATTPIRVSAAARTGVPAVEVMLVLDKTASMSETISGSTPPTTKIEALRTAATNLANQIMDGTKVKVGIVPFSRYVNIGMGLRTEPGFNIAPDSTSCSMQLVRVYDWSSPYNCVTTTGTCYNNIYDVEGNLVSSTPYTCTTTNCLYPFTDVMKNVCTSQTWSGCVGSRASPLDATDLQTTTPVPGAMNTLCGSSPITRLTLNKSTVLSGISGLAAQGQTYIPAGLMMGWHALSHRPILPDGADPSTPTGAGTLRAMILMTDGENTRSRNTADHLHSSTNITAANQLTRDLCENIKADGIQLYTVAFDVDASVVNMMEDCASSPSMAFDAADGAALNAAFQAIGDSLDQLRLIR